MTGWRQIEVRCSDEPAPELVPVFAVETRLRIEGGDDRLIDLAADAGFAAKPGEWLDVLPSSGRQTRTILIGTPTCGAASEHDWASFGGSLTEAMTALRLETARLRDMASLDDTMLEKILLGAQLHSFGYANGRKFPDPAPRPRRLLVASRAEGACKAARRTAAIVNRARAWIEAPANRLTPQIWAGELPAIFEPLGASVRLFDATALETMGAEALLAVGRASEHGPLLTVVEWRGAPEREGWDAVLVGKGLTFDTGGLNLKSGATGIAKMGFDMGGGAAVLGAVELAASRAARCNVVAVVPMAENAVDARSFRPGDVISSLGGLTIQIVNTDAEGRLVLADGIAHGILTYKPGHIVDVATLTGMVAIALLEEYAAIYSNDDRLASDLIAAGEATGERLWRMPCEANQDYVVETPVADVANMSTFAGALGVGVSAPVSGPKLLQKFVGDTPWAHLDIAGTAWAARRSAYSGKNATGYGVRLLDQWLRRFEPA